MNQVETQVASKEDLVDTQIRLEQEMSSEGASRYWRNVSKAIEGQREDGTAYGRQILASRITKLASAIAAWKEEALSGKVGRLQTAAGLTKDLNPEVLAYLTLKNVIQGITTPRTLQYVAVQIGTAISDEIRLAQFREQDKHNFKKLEEGAAKRVSNKHRHMYALRMNAHHPVEGWTDWTRTDTLHVGIKMLDILINSIGLVDIVDTRTGKNHSAKYVKARPETIDWITKKNEGTQWLRPVYEPMVVRPRDWTGPYDGGYISHFVTPLTLVKTRNKAYLEELANTDMPIVYEALNSLQQTPWQINSRVLDVMKEFWGNGTQLAGLPPKDGLPVPAKPFDMETNEEARKEWRCAAAKVHQENLSIMGQRVGFSIALDIAERYKDFRKIYFPYQMDFRGRIYAVPFLNPQGSDYHKALLRFSEGKPLGSEGWKWLAIHGANVAGNDKVSLEDRVNWVLDNEEEILRCAEDPYQNLGWCKEIAGVEIDKPWQFLAFCFEWEGYCKYGEDYVSKIPVALDGSCSGIQHFSAMLRDEVGGKAVNLIPADLPQDVYRLVAHKVEEAVRVDLENGTEDSLKHTEDGYAYVAEGTKTLAKQWLEFGITRKTTKRSVMTLAYGSKEYGFKDQLLEDIIRPAHAVATREGRPFAFSGDGYRAALYMAKKIWEAVNAVLVGPARAMAWLQDIAKLVASEELPVSWTTPVGFPVQQEYRSVNQRRVKTAINGSLTYLIMNEDTDKMDKRKMASAVSPNFVHSCDAAHLQLTVVRAKQEDIKSFAMIHDSFGTTAGQTEDLFRIVRECFVEMYQTVDVLQAFRDEIAAQISEENRENLPTVPPKGQLDVSQVVFSRFCFA